VPSTSSSESPAHFAPHRLRGGRIIHSRHVHSCGFVNGGVARMLSRLRLRVQSSTTFMTQAAKQPRALVPDQ
jgi:hypothetical protein